MAPCRDLLQGRRQQDNTVLHTTPYHTSYLPMSSLAHIIPCPTSDRCDTTGVSVTSSRRSVPVISRFCPTLGWLHLVKNVTHRAAAHVSLPVSTVLNVPDMWSRDEDNLLLQTIANTIPLNDYNPKWDYFWNKVAAEIPGRLPQQCRERYMSTSFLAHLAWFFFRISVGSTVHTVHLPSMCI